MKKLMFILYNVTVPDESSMDESLITASSKEPLRRCDICGEVATMINPVARTRKNGLDQSCRRCDKFYKENQEKYGAFQRMPDHKEWCPVFLGLEN